MQISTIGGSSETLAKALTVKPRGSPSRTLVTTVTPVGKCRIAALKFAGVGGPCSFTVCARLFQGPRLAG